VADSSDVRVQAPLFLRIPNWLGDLVLAWPVVRAAAERAAIVAGPAAFEPLVLGRFPRAEYVPVSRARRYAAVGAIRKRRPGAALLLTDSLSSALLAWMARIPMRVGYGAEGRSWFLTHPVPRQGRARSAPRTAEYRVLALAAGLDVPDSGEEALPALGAVAGERASGAAALAAAGLGDASFTVLAPGAAYGPAKQWGPERFASVGGHLARRHGLASVVVGSAADAALAGETARFAAAAGARVLNLAGRTTISELVGIVADARVVVSNDSGVMHLAAALGRPTVGVFGSTSPVWTASDTPWTASLYAEYPCSPCFRRTCPIGYGCLRSIEAEAGINAVERLLATEPHAPAQVGQKLT
jgi:lipopolysaccharide heptosyltransferase II